MGVGGVVWANCLSDDARDAALARAAPALGMLAAAFEGALDCVIAVWDWGRAKVGSYRGRNAAEAAYFEPLAEDEDFSSPPLFPGAGGGR